ncbi:MAG: hypothetical protein J6C98_02120 [Oscillospiraceae bacterium]|nr:hypothetical protein [Oscillospiraceae bacterium]
MGWYVLSGMLAAFGLFCCFWVILGSILPGSSGGVMLCPGGPGFPERCAVRRYVFLAEAGILRCPLLVVDMGLETRDRQWLEQFAGRIEICTPEEVFPRLELERNGFG